MRQVLPFPADLPGTLAEVRWSAGDAVRTISRTLRERPATPDDLHATLAHLPHRPEGVKLDRWDWHERTRRTEQFAILDQFFGVTRAAAGSTELLAHSAARAYAALLENTFAGGSDIGREQWNELCWGLERIIEFATDGRRGEPGSHVVPGARAARDPHLRWRIGHQVFFPLVQATIVGLRCFISAVVDGDCAAARESMVFADDVMRASARALEFASDFAPDTYTREVRPSMAPPGTPQGLSGLMSADHHEMVVVFQMLRPVAATLDPSVRPLYDGFVETVQDTYQAHVHVCSRFRGDHVVSLRMSHATSMSASGVLKQLAAGRVKGLRRP